VIRIGVLGTGYVGLVTGACLADFGHRVVCSDIDTAKIEGLKRGEIPIYEPGLGELVERNRDDHRLSFTTNITQAIEQSQVLFIAVGTPPKPDGSADLSAIWEAGKLVAKHHGGSYKVVVQKSTAPVGTARKLWEQLKKSAPAGQIDVASNPEFLREGSAIETFMRADRVIIGAETPRAEKLMREIYRPLYLIETPMVVTGLETAELIKYAANAFLATKVSFINEMANLCEAFGADVQVVSKGIGLDGRIGRKFLHAGPGYGGSCFPKDTKALVSFGQAVGEPMRIVSATIETNRAQHERMVKKIESAVGNLKGKRIALLGLAFKPNTDDIREAPPLAIARGLLRLGATVVGHDPVAMDNVAASPIGSKLEFALDAYSAADGAHAVVLATEWNQYRRLDLTRIAKQLKKPVLLDLRNVYDPDDAVRAGLEYYCVGRPSRGTGRKPPGAARVSRPEERKRKPAAPAAKPAKQVRPARATKPVPAARPAKVARKKPAAVQSNSVKTKASARSRTAGRSARTSQTSKRKRR
jgi:UDPglucose 6-dehydrogenase